MHHEFSFLYALVNSLLIKLFGAPPEAWLKKMGLEHEVAWLPDHVIMTIFVVLFLITLFSIVKRNLSIEAPGKAQQCLELMVSGLREVCKDVIGHGWERHLPFISGLAIFIFFCNICGIFFFLQPSTAVTSTTFALSIIAFIYYNYHGVKENGIVNYAKHFMGPMPILAPLMIPIEIISHLARILSLALRLFGNIFGEHAAAASFFAMFPFIVPWPMMGLGIFGSLLQAFIFIMLTMVYIQGAVAHDH